MSEAVGIGSLIFALAWYNIFSIMVIGIIFLLCVFNELLEGAIVFFVFTIGVLAWHGVVDLKNLDYFYILYFTLSYFAAGSVWSFFKYKNEAERIVKLNKRHNYDRITLLEKIEDNISKSQISFWVLFFPISIIKFLLSDFVDYIISKLGGVYKTIAKYVINKATPNYIVEEKQNAK